MRALDHEEVGTIFSVEATRFGLRLSAPGGKAGVALNTYLMTSHEDRHVLGVVQRAEDDRLWMNPVGEVVRGRFSRGVSQYPVPGVPVVRPDPRFLEALLGGGNRNRFSLGAVDVAGENVTIGLNPSLLFGRHLAIVGQSGAGKSWAVANLLQRTTESMPNAHVVVLDLHGEYWWKDREGKVHAAFKAGTARGVDARQLEIPYWILTFAELVDVLVDRRDPHASTQIAFLRETVEYLRRKANPGDSNSYITVDTPVFFPLEGLFEAIKEANDQMLDFGKTEGPLYGKFDELLLRFESRMTDNRYDFLFKPKKRKSSASLESLLREFVGLGPRPAAVTVIDMSGIPFDVRPTVSAQVGRLAFEFNYWNPDRRGFPLFLVCEEAHAYVPREAGGPYEGARRSMNRIAREGRKYGVGLCVVSQRPRDVSETVLAQCGNFLCLRLTNPDDQRYVRQLVPEGERDLLEALPALRRGEVIALGEALDMPTRLQLYRPSPAPHSKDVDFKAGWTADAATADVADIVDRWRWQRR